MKLLEFKFQRLTAVLLPTAALWASPLVAAPIDHPPKAEPRRSVFVLPASAKEGRDPFFPNSTRPYETATTTTNKVPELNALVCKGISGGSDHPLAIINNHTFAVGDEEDVLTVQGRIRVHCIEIKSRSVVIEVGGQRHELTFSDNP